MSAPPSSPSLWIKLDLGPRGQIGPGKIRLLRAIGETRSISGAARAMGMSYRRAWRLVEELNESFGAPVVETRVGGQSGGGANLTRMGTEIVSGYEKILMRAQAATTAETEAFRRLFDP